MVNMQKTFGYMTLLLDNLGSMHKVEFVRMVDLADIVDIVDMVDIVDYMAMVDGKMYRKRLTKLALNQT